MGWVQRELILYSVCLYIFIIIINFGTWIIFPISYVNVAEILDIIPVIYSCYNVINENSTAMSKPAYEKKHNFNLDSSKILDCKYN